VTANLNKNSDNIRAMIDLRLKSVARGELLKTPEPHLDEDVLAAFVEGRLADVECRSVLAHLASCGLCRRTSAQFVQLENQIDDEISPASGDEEPGRLEALISRLSSAMPSASDEVVFAYQNPSEEEGDKTPTTPPTLNDHEDD